MLKPALPLAILALGLTGTLIHAAAPAPHPIHAIEGIEWTYDPDDEGRIELRHDHMNSTFDASELPEVADQLAAASSSSPGEAVTFALVREAGALACTGKRTASGARGTCRFDPTESYVAALSERGLRPEDSEEAFALAIVDARIDQVDGLARAGFDVREVGDLLAVAALEVCPSYVEELKEAGLDIAELDDLVAAKALGISAAWLTEMADAGFPDLTVDQAISMRALDVTPDYARRMKRVAASVGELM